MQGCRCARGCGRGFTGCPRIGPRAREHPALRRHQSTRPGSQRRISPTVDFGRRRSTARRRVYQELTRTPEPFAHIDAIADTLRMTSRPLRRKLDAGGTSYSEL